MGASPVSVVRFPAHAIIDVLEVVALEYLAKQGVMLNCFSGEASRVRYRATGEIAHSDGSNTPPHQAPTV